MTEKFIFQPIWYDANNEYIPTIVWFHMGASEVKDITYIHTFDV